MRTGHLLLAALAAAAISSAALPSKATAQPDGLGPVPDRVPGRLLVKLSPGLDEHGRAAIHASVGARPLRHFAKIGVDVVEVPEGTELERARAYGRLKQVEYAEPDYLVWAVEIPNDALFGQQWGLSTIQAPTAWDTARGAGVLIAVLDTGMDIDHPELASKIAASVDCTSLYGLLGCQQATAQDYYGHGTHVAGIAAAVTGNGAGVAGVAPAARLLNVKVLGDDGSGKTSTIVAGIEWAADHGAGVINMSLGGTSYSSSFADAVAYAWNHGTVVVAAAGNSASPDPFYPAAYPGCLAVAATGSGDVRASFSNYGSWIDLAAPGVSILSTYLNGGYTSMSGTSMASPHVAGVAALVRSRNPGWTNSQVVAQLESSADAIADTGLARFGRVNAARAVGTAAPQPSKMHVGDLDGAMVSYLRRWRARVTVRVDNASHQPLSGIAVTGQWSSGGTSSCTTGSTGTCVLQSGLLNASVTLRVTGLSGGGFTYDSAANHDPDGDSNGTSIYVRRP